MSVRVAKQARPDLTVVDSHKPVAPSDTEEEDPNIPPSLQNLQRQESAEQGADGSESKGQEPWLVVIVAPTLAVTHGVRNRIDEFDLTPKRHYEFLDYSGDNIADWMRTNAPDRKRNVCFSVGMDSCPDVLETVSKIVIAARPMLQDSDGDDQSTMRNYRRCVLHCQERSERGTRVFIPVSWLQLIGYDLYAAHPLNIRPVELLAAVEYTEGGVECQLRQVINNLPATEQSGHWHQSLGRHLHDSTVTEDETVIHVCKTPFEDKLLQTHREEVPVLLEFDEQPQTSLSEDWMQHSSLKGTLKFLFTCEPNEVDDAKAIQQIFKNAVEKKLENWKDREFYKVPEICEVEKVTATNSLDVILKRTGRPFFIYHAGHGNTSMLSNASIEHIVDTFKEDLCHIAFLNSCSGRSLAQAVSGKVDNVIYWEDEVDSQFAGLVAKAFFEKFVEEFGTKSLVDCVAASYQHVLQTNFGQYRFGPYASGGPHGQLSHQRKGRTIAGPSFMKLTVGGTELRISTSPPNRLSLSRPSRERARIPHEAQYYIFMNPFQETEVGQVKSIVDEYASKLQSTVIRKATRDVYVKLLSMVLQHGAFVYMAVKPDVNNKQRKHVLSMNAYSIKHDVFRGRHNLECGVLNTDGYQPAKKRLRNRVAMARRCENLPFEFDADGKNTRDEHGDIIPGMRPTIYKTIAWVRPMEMLHDNETTFQHGAFVETWYLGVADATLNLPAYSAKDGKVLAIRRSA